MKSVVYITPSRCPIIANEKLNEEVTKINNKPRHVGPQFKFSEITGLEIKKNS